jgi:hypothetical protein
LRPTATVPFAHAISSAWTRLGTAAVDAEKNGAWAAADTSAMASMIAGVVVSARHAIAAPAARSDAIITLRRSKRSPSAPPNGVRTPVAPQVRRSVADIQAADPVAS